MKIGMIGAGKVGCSLGKLFSQGGVTLSGYHSRSIESARKAAAFTDSQAYDDIETLVNDSDAVILTVPDGAITSVYESLCKLEITGKFICHCSGARSAEQAFPGLATHGAHGISIHPLFPVSSRYESWQELADAFFCVEGDDTAVAAFRPLLEGLGVHVQIIAPESKVRYHAACVMASNFMCGLMAESLSLLAGCGFDEPLARTALAPLMESNLRHLLHDGPVAALTGPIERADTTTVAGHLAALEGEQRELYRLMSRRLTALGQEKHPTQDYQQMLTLLDR